MGAKIKRIHKVDAHVLVFVNSFNMLPIQFVVKSKSITLGGEFIKGILENEALIM